MNDCLFLDVLQIIMGRTRVNFVFFFFWSNVLTLLKPQKNEFCKGYIFKFYIKSMLTLLTDKKYALKPCLFYFLNGNNKHLN